MMVMNVTVSRDVSVSLPVVEDREGAEGRYLVAPGENFAEMLKPGQACMVVAGNSPALSCAKRGTIKSIDRNNAAIAIFL